MHKSEKTQNWSQNQIIALLHSDDQFVLRALLKLYSFQTHDEQYRNISKIRNKKGFTGADAPVLSSISKKLINDKQISKKQFIIVKYKIQKYSKQLTKIANTPVQTNIFNY